MGGRIEDIGSGSGAAKTETVENQNAKAGAGMNDGGDDSTIKTDFANGGEGEEPSAEKAAAAEAQQDEARASEAAEQMDKDTEPEQGDTRTCESQTCDRKAECEAESEATETQVEDPPNAKHPQVAFAANNGEQCDVEIGDRVVCYCQGNRVVLDVVEKHDNDVLVGINQSSSDFLSNTAKIEAYDRIIFSNEDVHELAVKP